MKKSKTNMRAILSGIGIIVTSVIIGMSVSLPGLEMIIMPLQIIGLILIATGTIRYFKLSIWWNIPLIIILTPILYIIFFYLMWGFTTGFSFIK